MQSPQQVVLHMLDLAEPSVLQTRALGLLQQSNLRLKLYCCAGGLPKITPSWEVPGEASPHCTPFTS